MTKTTLKRLPARIAFPGWVIFRPAAAAKRRLPSHTLWAGLNAELSAAGCSWEPHPRLQIASSHGPVVTLNGLYKDDILLSANKNKRRTALLPNTTCVLSNETKPAQSLALHTAGWLMNIKTTCHATRPLIGPNVWFDYSMQIFHLLNINELYYLVTSAVYLQIASMLLRNKCDWSTSGNWDEMLYEAGANASKLPASSLFAMCTKCQWLLYN